MQFQPSQNRTEIELNQVQLTSGKVMEIKDKEWNTSRQWQRHLSNL